jgi:hypothetical protein
VISNLLNRKSYYGYRAETGSRLWYRGKSWRVEGEDKTPYTLSAINWAILLCEVIPDGKAE